MLKFANSVSSLTKDGTRQGISDLKYKTRRQFLIKSLSLFVVASLLSCISMHAHAQETNVKNQSQVIVFQRPIIAEDSNSQMELQLQQQELQLEQQVLQIKMRLLQLKQQDVQQKKTKQAMGNLHWQAAKNGDVPADAVIGGYVAGKPLHICHANYFDEGIHPGQMVARGCLITYAGRSYVQPDYEVLAGKQNIIWQSPNALPLPKPPLPVIFAGMSPAMTSGGNPIPVQGGYENGHPLYICRAVFTDQIHLGKVVSESCFVGIKDSEVSIPTYEVLFVKP